MVTYKTRTKVDFVKLQVPERDEELTKLNEEFHQNKRKIKEKKLCQATLNKELRA